MNEWDGENEPIKMCWSRRWREIYTEWINLLAVLECAHPSPPWNAAFFFFYPSLFCLSYALTFLSLILFAKQPLAARTGELPDLHCTIFLHDCLMINVYLMSCISCMCVHVYMCMISDMYVFANQNVIVSEFVCVYSSLCVFLRF